MEYLETFYRANSYASKGVIKIDVYPALIILLNTSYHLEQLANSRLDKVNPP
jgi:hypothetical protein